jgi:hypothetical protein
MPEPSHESDAKFAVQYCFEVKCVSSCNRTGIAKCVEVQPGIYGILPPDTWFVRHEQELVFFCCAECAPNLGIECKCCKSSKKRRTH